MPSVFELILGNFWDPLTWASVFPFWLSPSWDIPTRGANIVYSTRTHRVAAVLTVLVTPRVGAHTCCMPVIRQSPREVCTLSSEAYNLLLWSLPSLTFDHVDMLCSCLVKHIPCMWMALLSGSAQRHLACPPCWWQCVKSWIQPTWKEISF